MSGEVIALAREAIGCCAICRKYIRLPNKPQMRVRGANVFNQAVQMDLYYWESTWFMLLVDEATRFKKSGTIEGQEADQLLQAFLELWIYHFGPPERLVLDQQVSLMSHEAGAEFERLGIMMPTWNHSWCRFRATHWNRHCGKTRATDQADHVQAKSRTSTTRPPSN